MAKFKKTFIKIAVSFFTALFFLFQSPSPILATAVTDTYTDTTKINTSASSTYSVSGGQAKILSLGGNAGWWKMDEASGNTAADSSGNGNTGTASPFASGGTITSSGGYTIHTFTSNGAFSPYGSVNVEALVVAGGGGAGALYQGSGGGGGGIVYNSSYAVAVAPDVITFTSTNVAAANAYTYWKTLSDSTTLATNDTIEYDVYLNTNTSSTGGIDIRFTDATYARSFTWADQNALSCYAANITSQAYGQWYHRICTVPAAVNGKTISWVDLVNELDTATATSASYDNFIIKNSSGAVKSTVYTEGSPDFNVADFTSNAGNTGSATAPNTVTVGAGGSGSAIGGQTQTNGGDSIFGNMTAYGGGRGGSESLARSNGGSGGGGSHNANYSAGTATQGINGTARYGNSGGAVTGSNQSPWNAAGGGGAGAVGQTVAVNGATPGAGGDGISSSISGSAVFYGGGGAGSNRTSATNSGGNGGGGATGVAGTANTGGGGGGGSQASSPQRIGGAGGSGIVIIRYPSATYYGTSVVAGQYGNARSFNGTSDYIKVNDSSPLQLTTSLTLEAWFKTSSTGAIQSILRKDTETGTRYLWGLSVRDTNILRCDYYNGTTFNVDSPGTVTDGQWHHATLTISGTTLTCYLDGSSLGSTAITGTQGAPTGELDIGANPPFVGGGTRAQFFNGQIDDIRIYNYARTLTQIANDKNNTTYETAATIQSTNLLSGESSIISSLDNFVYNLSSKPTGTTATIQFSQDASSWYNSSGTLNGTDTLTTGANNTISMASLGWDTANFYYKMAFGGDGTNSPVLDDITLNYTTTGTCTAPPAGGGNYTVSSNCAFAPTSETSIVRDLGSTPGHGTITGTSSVPGKYGTARKFNGTSDYLSIPDSAALDITGDFTISVWANRAGVGNNSLVSKVAGSPPSGGGYGLLTGNAGEIYCRTSDGPGWTDSYTATGLLTTSTGWTHLAIVRTGTSCRVWVNGVDRTQTANTHTTVTANASNLTIGRRTDGSEYFNGQIDDVRIYNYARSESQIKEDMNEAPMTTNLPVGWWKMDDGYIGGVDNGNITVATGTTLTVNSGQTLVWNPGKSIIIENGASIALNVRSRLKQAYLYVTDGDGDNYPTSDSKLRWADVAPGNGTRWYLAGATSDCNDANVNIYQNLSTVAADTDQDGYTVSAPSTECVGTPTTISSRTYYKDSAGTYTWLLDSEKLGTSDCDSADSSVAVTRTQRLNADGDSYTVAGSSFCASPSTWGNSACSTAGSDYSKNSAASCLLVGVLGGDDCSDANSGPNLCCWARPAGTCNANCNVTGCSTQQTSRFCVSGTQCGFETVTCYGNSSDCGCSSDGTGICEQRTSSFTRYNTCQLPGGVCTLSNSSTCWEGILSCTWSW